MSYFHDIFTTSKPCADDIARVVQNVNLTLPSHLFDFLQEPFMKEEVKKVVFDMHPTKAPGLDGFQPLFFQKLWP